MRAATTKAQADRANEIDRIAQEQADNDLRAVMATASGRRFVWGLLAECGLYRLSYHPSALIHFNEGQRSIGLSLLGRVTGVCPDEYLLMQGEAIEEQRKAADRAAIDLNDEEDDHE